MTGIDSVSTFLRSLVNGARIQLKLPKRIDLHPFWALLGQHHEHTPVLELHGGVAAGTQPVPDEALAQGSSPSFADRLNFGADSEQHSVCNQAVDEEEGPLDLLLGLPTSSEAADSPQKPGRTATADARRALNRLTSRVAFTAPASSSEHGNMDGVEQASVPRLDLSGVRSANRKDAVESSRAYLSDCNLISQAQLPLGAEVVLHGLVLHSVSASMSHACAIDHEDSCAYIWQRSGPLEKRGQTGSRLVGHQNAASAHDSDRDQLHTENSGIEASHSQSTPCSVATLEMRPNTGRSTSHLEAGNGSNLATTMGSIRQRLTASRAGMQTNAILRARVAHGPMATNTETLHTLENCKQYAYIKVWHRRADGHRQ
jgi:hypothetical protein